MDNRNAQLLVGATAAIGSFELILSLKNLFAADRMKNAPPDYEGLQGHYFKLLRDETIVRCMYEITGVVMNCGLLAAKIWIGYYPVIWDITFRRLGKWQFLTYWVFQLADILVNYLIFAPIKIQIIQCRGTPGVKMKSLATGHMDKLMPVGTIGLAIMIFAKDVNPKIWFFLPIAAAFDDILLVTVEQYHFKRLVESDPDSAITKQVGDVAEIYRFPRKNIYKNPNEKEIPEANYYELGHLVVVSEKLLSLPEKTAVVLISQEIGLYTRRHSWMNFFVPLVRWVGLGFLLVQSFDNDVVGQVFGFDDTPYPYVPMYLAYAYVWPVFSNILYRIECLSHSSSTLKADIVIHQSTSNQGVPALKAVAGRAEKYPIFDEWYSQLMRGYPTVAQRIKNIESPQWS